MANGPIRAPRSLTEAQRLCEAWAQIDGDIAVREGVRDAAIATVNATADTDLAPLIERRAAIVAKLQPWWGENAVQLTQGKRKSAELGGAVLGTRAGRPSIALQRAASEIIADLRKTAWGRALLRTTVDIDKVALATALAGRNAAALQALGVSLSVGMETFTIARTRQAGTQAKVQR